MSGVSVTAWRDYPGTDSFEFVDGVIDKARADSFSNYRMDDETHRRDGKRWPNRTLCTRPMT